jgi:hypothetical protein
MRHHRKPTIEILECRSLLSLVAPHLGHYQAKAHPEHVRHEVLHTRRFGEHARKHVPANAGRPVSSESGTSSSNTSTALPPTNPSPIPVTGSSSAPLPPIVTAPSPTSTPITTTPITTSPLAVSVTTNQAIYLPGQTVTMTFTETNRSDSTVRVPIGPSIDGFTITQDGATVWNSNSGIEPDFIVLENLAPGASITLTATWTASNLTGTFAVHNQLEPDGAAATFEVVAGMDVTH